MSNTTATKPKKAALNQKAVGAQAMTALKIGGGIMAGNVIGGFIDKTLKVDATAKLPKRLAGPLVMIALGAVIAIKAKDPNAKCIGTGVAVSGVMRVAKAVMPNAGLAGELGLGSLNGNNAYASNRTPWTAKRDAQTGHLSFPELEGVYPPETNYRIPAPAHNFHGVDGDEQELLGLDGEDDYGVGGDDDYGVGGADDDYAMAGIEGADDEQRETRIL